MFAGALGRTPTEVDVYFECNSSTPEIYSHDTLRPKCSV
jgi:hypothetical protein